MRRRLTIEVNGERRKLRVDPDQTLLSVLRDELGLTGTKYGCGEGQCGACTVLLDSTATRSCLLRVGNVIGRKITTIEGIQTGDELHAVQQAFVAHDALQCGYCTSGMIVAAVGLLERNPDPTESEIRRGMDGNVCRCGTYPRIVSAIQAAAKAGKSNNGGGR